MDLSQIETVVFAGGGNRCFWQAGAWSILAPITDIQPKEVVSVSAGAAISTAILAGRAETALAETQHMTRNNERNQYWNHLFGPKRVFPQEDLYRALIRQVLDNNAWQRLQQGPPNRIAIARPPNWLGPRSATMVGISAYQVEKHWRGPVHPILGRRLGFRQEFISTHDLNSPDELADLIIASSCTPPFTRIARWDNRTALDGGLVDNVPVQGCTRTQAPCLVLLTRPYPRIPNHPNRLYLQPSRKPPVAPWDYTDPDAIQAAYTQGQADAQAFLEQQRS